MCVHGAVDEQTRPRCHGERVTRAGCATKPGLSPSASSAADSCLTQGGVPELVCGCRRPAGSWRRVGDGVGRVPCLGLRVLRAQGLCMKEAGEPRAGSSATQVLPMNWYNPFFVENIAGFKTLNK